MRSLYPSARIETLRVGDDRLKIAFASFLAEKSPASRRFILLHGNPSHMDHWAATVDALRAFGDVATLDMPGFGKSETPHDGVMSLDRLADSVASVADAVGFQDFIVMGQSFGGAVAQTVAARFPNRVRAVVLIATIGTPANPSVRMARIPGAEWASKFVAQRLGNRGFQGFARRFAEFNARVNFAPDEVPPGFAEADFQMVAERPEIQANSVRANVRDPSRQLVAQASAIRAPVLMVHPRDDRVVPLVYAQNLCRELHEAGVAVTFEICQGGHVAHVTHANEVDSIVRNWIETLG